MNGRQVSGSKKEGVNGRDWVFLFDMICTDWSAII
jgi:hypothetical protein